MLLLVEIAKKLVHWMLGWNFWDKDFGNDWVVGVADGGRKMEVWRGGVGGVMNSDKLIKYYFAYSQVSKETNIWKDKTN